MDSESDGLWGGGVRSAGDFSPVVYGARRVGTEERPGRLEGRRADQECGLSMQPLYTAPELLTFHLIPHDFLSTPAGRNSPPFIIFHCCWAHRLIHKFMQSGVPQLR